MSKPEGWDEFVQSLVSGRPWEVNDVTDALSKLVPQKDIAEVVYSFFRGGSVDFLTQSNRDLDGKKPVDLLQTEDGLGAIRRFLMSNPWL